MKSNLFLVLGLALFCWSCTPQPAQFKITSKNLDQNTVLSIYSLANHELYKAENLHNGTQQFQLNLPQKGYASLEIDVSDKKRKYWFYLDGGEYALKIDGNRAAYPIVGTSNKQQQQLMDFYATNGRNEQVIIDSVEFAAALLDAANPGNVSIRAQNMEKWQTKLISVKIDAIGKFAAQYPDSELSILLMQEAGDIGDHPQYFTKIFNSLDESVRKGKLGQKFNVQLERANKMAVGSIMPNIEGRNLAGQKFDKKILKPVNLIICWAAYSGKSQRDNLSLVNLYEQFKSKGVEFISVSFDNYEASWKSGIAKSNMSWPQYSDLLGAKSPNAKNLSNFNASYYFIIDGSGKVIANNLTVDLISHELDKAIAKNTP